MLPHKHISWIAALSFELVGDLIAILIALVLNQFLEKIMFFHLFFIKPMSEIQYPNQSTLKGKVNAIYREGKGI